MEKILTLFSENAFLRMFACAVAVGGIVHWMKPVFPKWARAYLALTLGAALGLFYGIAAKSPMKEVVLEGIAGGFGAMIGYRFLVRVLTERLRGYLTKTPVPSYWPEPPETRTSPLSTSDPPSADIVSSDPPPPSTPRA